MSRNRLSRLQLLVRREPFACSAVPFSRELYPHAPYPAFNLGKRDESNAWLLGERARGRTLLKRLEFVMPWCPRPRSPRPLLAGKGDVATTSRPAVKESRHLEYKDIVLYLPSLFTPADILWSSSSNPQHLEVPVRKDLQVVKVVSYR